MRLHCFAYGTLMCEDIMARISGIRSPFDAAVLHGYARHPVIDEPYPGIAPHEGRTVAGRLYRDLDAAAFERLDAFEGDQYTRATVRVALDDGSWADAQTYVFRSALEHLLMPGEWDFEHFLHRERHLFISRYGGFGRI